MGYLFNGENKYISIEGLTTLNILDLWSRWNDWVEISDNSKYPIAFSQVGGDSINESSGTSIPIYLFLNNGWKIKPMESNHTLNVTNGILLVTGGGDPFISTIGNFNVKINYQQPVQAITVSTSGGGGGTSPSAEEIAFAVWNTLTSNINNAGTIGKLLINTESKVDDILSIEMIR